MKIAVFHNLTSGGGKRALEELCHGLYKRGHCLDLFIMDTADEKYLPLDKYINTKKVFPAKGNALFGLPDYNSRSFASGWKWIFGLGRLKNLQRKIAGYINSSDCDLAFVCGCIYTQAPFILRFIKIPSLYLCQEPLRTLYESPKLQGLDNFKGKIYLACASLILKDIDAKNISSASLVLANSYYSRESILRVYGIDAKVNYLGVDTDKFRPLNLQKENLVISVGGLQPRKGYRFIIESLAMIDEQNRPKFVILADKHYYRENEILKNLACTLRVDLDIVINASDEEVVCYYNRAKAVIFVPYLEPFGFVSLEAMACGTPVIAINEGGIREVVIDGENGILLDRDKAQFAKAIKRILLNPIEAKSLALRAIENVKDKWSWDKSLDGLEYNLKILPTYQSRKNAGRCGVEPRRERCHGYQAVGLHLKNK